MMLAYVGPEVAAPVLSAVAAVVGFLLIGWRWTLDKIRRVYRFVFRIPAPTDETLDDPTLDDDDAQEKD